MLVVGIANFMWPTYGVGFLTLMESLYPGYQAGTGLVSVVAGALYGLVDGAVGGAAFAPGCTIFSPRKRRNATGTQ